MLTHNTHSATAEPHAFGSAQLSSVCSRARLSLCSALCAQRCARAYLFEELEALARELLGSLGLRLRDRLLLLALGALFVALRDHGETMVYSVYRKHRCMAKTVGIDQQVVGQWSHGNQCR